MPNHVGAMKQLGGAGSGPGYIRGRRDFLWSTSSGQSFRGTTGWCRPEGRWTCLYLLCPIPASASLPPGRNRGFKANLTTNHKESP